MPTPEFKGALFFSSVSRSVQIETREHKADLGHATRNDIVDDIVDVSSSTMAFNVAKITSVRASLTISLTKSLRVAGPRKCRTIYHRCSVELLTFVFGCL